MSTYTETLTWTPAHQHPDAGILKLLHFEREPGDEEVYPAEFDGELWRFEGGDPVIGIPIEYADLPAGTRPGWEARFGNPDLLNQLKGLLATEPARPFLLQPFTVGDWTYFGNGHVMAWVPAIEGVRFGTATGDLSEKVLHTLADLDRSPVEWTVPEPIKICEFNGETGHRLLKWAGGWFDHFNIAQIKDLPGLEVFLVKPAGEFDSYKLRFRFTGGEGLMAGTPEVCHG